MKKKIAAIDDNDDLLFTIKLGITKSDKTFDVITFNDPNEFLKEADKTKFDVVLLDIMMPQKNGWDTFADIKKSKMNSKTPILFLTAKTNQQSLILGSCGAQDYITKPFNVPDLIMKIKKHVKE